MSKKKLLEKEYKKELNIQKQKNETIKEGLEAHKRKMELEEIKRRKKLQLSANERKDERTFKEAGKLEKNFRLKELEKKNPKQEKTIAGKSEISTHKKNKDTNSGVTTNKSNALIIIRGQDEDHGIFKELLKNMEFELLSGDIKASTHILNTKQAFDEKRVLDWNKSKYDYLLLINQMEKKEDGDSVFKISIYSEKTNSKWQELSENSYDLSDPLSLKELSNSVLKLQ